MCICMGIGQTYPVEKNVKDCPNVINAINYYNYNSLFNKNLLFLCL